MALSEEELKARNRARHARYVAANPEKMKANQARYRAANPERVKAKNAKYRAANPEKVKASQAKWRAANPEMVKAGNARDHAAHPERVLYHSVKFDLGKGTSLRPSEIPQELIDLKIKQLQMRQVMYEKCK